MTKRRLRIATLALTGLGLGALTVAGGGQDDQDARRPVAVVPETEGPTPGYLELQKRATRQPSGQLVDGGLSRTPAIASPSR